jgi:hypothetical protein
VGKGRTSVRPYNSNPPFKDFSDFLMLILVPFNLITQLLPIFLGGFVVGDAGVYGAKAQLRTTTNFKP